jgi:5-methylcytosine-specific restriction endonuclease McrA
MNRKYTHKASREKQGKSQENESRREAPQVDLRNLGAKKKNNRKRKHIDLCGKSLEYSQATKKVKKTTFLNTY